MRLAISGITVFAMRKIEIVFVSKIALTSSNELSMRGPIGGGNGKGFLEIVYDETYRDI